MSMEMFYPTAISYQIVEISYHSGNSCVFVIPFPWVVIKSVTLELLADLGALGNYPGSPFLPSDSEILLDSPENEDIGNGVCIYYNILSLLTDFSRFSSLTIQWWSHRKSLTFDGCLDTYVK
jgi:hypothetical protein